MFEIEHFLLVAEEVLGIDADRLKYATKLGAAESALAAPHASFGGHSFYEHPVQRAAVRLANPVSRLRRPGSASFEQGRDQPFRNVIIKEDLWG